MQAADSSCISRRQTDRQTNRQSGTEGGSEGRGGRGEGGKEGGEGEGGGGEGEGGEEGRWGEGKEEQHLDLINQCISTRFNPVESGIWIECRLNLGFSLVLSRFKAGSTQLWDKLFGCL